MNHTPLEKLLFESGQDLITLQKETRISYPTLINIKRGYKLKKIADKDGKKIKVRIKYEPDPRTLRDIAEYFKVEESSVYEDRSAETEEIKKKTKK